jgi:hypothetical protein
MYLEFHEHTTFPPPPWAPRLSTSCERADEIEIWVEMPRRWTAPLSQLRANEGRFDHLGLEASSGPLGPDDTRLTFASNARNGHFRREISIQVPVDPKNATSRIEKNGLAEDTDLPKRTETGRDNRYPLPVKWESRRSASAIARTSKEAHV